MMSSVLRLRLSFPISSVREIAKAAVVMARAGRATVFLGVLLSLGSVLALNRAASDWILNKEHRLEATPPPALGSCQRCMWICICSSVVSIGTKRLWSSIALESICIRWIYPIRVIFPWQLCVSSWIWRIQLIFPSIWKMTW